MTQGGQLAEGPPASDTLPGPVPGVPMATTGCWANQLQSNTNSRPVDCDANGNCDIPSLNANPF